METLAPDVPLQPPIADIDIDMLPDPEGALGLRFSVDDAAWLLKHRVMMLKFWEHIERSLREHRLQVPRALMSLSDSDLLDYVIRSDLFLRGDGSSDRSSLLQLCKSEAWDRWRKVYNDGRALISFIQRDDVVGAGPAHLWAEVNNQSHVLVDAIEAIHKGQACIRAMRNRRQEAAEQAAFVVR